MWLKAPKGMTSVSVGGKEYPVRKKDSLVDVPDHLYKELLCHGLTIAVTGTPSGNESTATTSDGGGKS